MELNSAREILLGAARERHAAHLLLLHYRLWLVALGRRGERGAGGEGGVWSTGALAADYAYELRGPFFPRGACAPGRRTLRTAVGNEKKHHAGFFWFFPYGALMMVYFFIRILRRRRPTSLVVGVSLVIGRRSHPPPGRCVTCARASC